ncbi:MAG: outer membrane protein assembly factor BamC [Methylococcaceae bacterium]|nr:outer membrane protein assembly factor BamC [Methylococcaceae bacterium]
MKIKIGSLLITATVLINLSACSYIKSLFPDKEKDYQYTTEIPPLILPADLKKTQVPGMPKSASSAPSSPSPSAPPVAVNATNATVEEAKSAAPAINESVVTSPAPAEQATHTTTPESESVVPDTAITVERVKFDAGENRLRINVPFIRAWRIVGKALSRKSIEVTERNQEARLITVLYDPDEQKVEDGSYWDEVVFVFSGIQSNEKKYLLKLEENNQQTDIVVVDEDQQILSDAASFKLLTLLQETIKADLATK